MDKAELKQKMMLCVTTLCNLNGLMPEAAELYGALGNEYKEVLEEFMAEKNALTTAA